MKSIRSSSACRHRFFLIFLLTLYYSVIGNGLPGEYLVNQMWRDVNTSHSPLTNSAFLTETQYLSVYISHAITATTGYQTSEGVFLFPIGKIHTLGLAYIGSGAQIENGTRWSNDSIVIITEKQSDRSNAYVLSYAVNPWNALSIGLNAQFYQHSLFGKPAKAGYGADIALSYKIIDNQKVGKHILGLSTHNLLLMGETGYSSAATFSWYGYMLDNVIESQLDVSLRDFMAAGKDFLENAGAKPDFDFSYKFGVWLLNAIKIYGHAGMKYFGFSGGLDFPVGYKDREILALYQFALPYGSVFPSHSIFAGAEFGEPRKDVVVKTEKRRASLIPSDLYNKAMQLYSEGKYWDAFWVFNKILVEYPDFIKNDWVSYYSGRCLEMLDIRTAAVAQYQRTMIKYSKSKAVSFANSGIMSVNYRENNTDGVEEQYKQLVNAHVPDSLRNHAHYLRGETYFKDKNYDKAIDMLSKVPAEHADYMYARHTMAVSSIIKENYDKALVYLKDGLSGTAKTPEDEEIVFRTFLLTGYLFYEEKEYSNALASLSMIPKKSIYYEDALLGMGWIALRAQQWEDCLGAARDLKAISQWVVNQGEGSLLEAYVHLMRKNYSEATTILNAASAQLNAAALPSQQEFQNHLDNYQNTRLNYELLGKTAEKFAMEKQTTEVLEKVDSLARDQITMKTNIDEHYKYVDAFNRENFFSRNLEMVRNDVDYALARASKMSALKKVVQEQEKSEKKAQDIDKEIEKLKEKMEKNKN